MRNEIKTVNSNLRKGPSNLTTWTTCSVHGILIEVSVDSSFKDGLVYGKN